CHQARERQGQAPAAGVRGPRLQIPRRRRRHPLREMVRHRVRLQRHGPRPARPLPRGPLQLLQSQILPQDRATARRSAHLSDRIHPRQELYPPRHQAGQLPDGHRQEGQPGQRDRFRSGQEVQGSEDALPHSVP
ncbi:hypothetical protein LTR74_018994, partial [Friedmanniomyces endolithicus]